jgi:hypothetical protein
MSARRDRPHRRHPHRGGCLPDPDPHLFPARHHLRRTVLDPRASWLSTLASYLPAQPLIDAVTRAVQRVPGAPFLNSRDMIVLACWAAGGLLAAILLFRWEPHRPARRRAARNKA